MNHPSAITFKQLEAIYWVVRLKGFQAAAEKCNTTQSAISKRIKDLEVLFDCPLFDRSNQTARLTEKGRDVFAMAEELLSTRDRALHSIQRAMPLSRWLRIGCTELTAMTWLPRLILELRDTFPSIVIEPEVNYAVNIVQRLRDGELDVAIVPEVLVDDSLTRLELGVVRHLWMCKPGMLDGHRDLSLQDLSTFTLLMQREEQSSAVRTYLYWLRGKNVELGKTIRCTSLHALIGMTVVGVGLGYLPFECVAAQIENGSLLRVPVQEPLPTMKFVIAYDPRSEGCFFPNLILISFVVEWN